MKRIIFIWMLAALVACSYNDSDNSAANDAERQAANEDMSSKILSLGDDSVQVTLANDPVTGGVTTHYHLPEDNKVVVIDVRSSTSGIAIKSVFVSFPEVMTEDDIAEWVVNAKALVEGRIGGPVAAPESIGLLPEGTVSAIAVNGNEVSLFVAETELSGGLILAEYQTDVTLSPPGETINLDIPPVEDVGTTAGLSSGDKVEWLDYIEGA